MILASVLCLLPGSFKLLTQNTSDCVEVVRDVVMEADRSMVSYVMLLLACSYEKQPQCNPSVHIFNIEGPILQAETWPSQEAVLVLAVM